MQIFTSYIDVSQNSLVYCTNFQLVKKQEKLKKIIVYKGELKFIGFKQVCLKYLLLK